MRPILEQLALDHVRCLRVLACIESQLSSQTNNLLVPDLNLLSSAMEYMSGYTDRFHHPLEESILYELEYRVRDDEFHRLVHNLRIEHICLVDASGKLEALYKKIRAGNLPFDHNAARLTWDYCQSLRSHIDIENREFLPLVKDHLEAEQLDKFARHHQYRGDPLFDVESRGDFEKLYHYLMDFEA